MRRLAEAAELKKLLEKKQLDALMQDLKEAIAKSQALQPFKDQLLLDITPEGLRIQILDAQNRPMFDLGSARLKPYTNDILREVTGYLRTVPNRLSVTGHTDTTPYAGITGYTNWDLSTDRANAARRALESAGPRDRAHRARRGPGVLGAVRQGEPAQRRQPPHQHRGDDAAGRAGCAEDGSAGRPVLDGGSRPAVGCRRAGWRSADVASAAQRGQPQLRALASASSGYVTRSRKSPRRIRSAMISL